MREKNLKSVDKIMTALQRVGDPGLLIGVVNLGLIYGINTERGHATIKMILAIADRLLSTYLQDSIEKAVLLVPKIKACDVKLAWHPVWSPERMMTATKQQLGVLDNEQALDQEEEVEDAGEKQKIIDSSVSIRKLTEGYPGFVRIMYNCGFVKIKIPGLLLTIGRVTTAPLGAQVMKIGLDRIRRAFENKGYKVTGK